MTENINEKESKELAENETDFPLATSKLAFFMPHRPPMVWVDEVLEQSDAFGRTGVWIRPGSLMLNGTPQIFPSALLEFFAQSYGYLQGTKAMISRRRLKLAYLAAVDQFTLTPEPRPRAGEYLTASLHTLRDMHPLHLIGGEVRNETGILLCTVKIKAYAIFADLGEIA